LVIRLTARATLDVALTLRLAEGTVGNYLSEAIGKVGAAKSGSGSAPGARCCGPALHHKVPSDVHLRRPAGHEPAIRYFDAASTQSPLRLNLSLVQVDAVVIDWSGNHISDLNAADFDYSRTARGKRLLCREVIGIDAPR
jgi:hypothetical protein